MFVLLEAQPFSSTQLPAISSLATDLKVCFIGDATCSANQQQIRKVLKVRREKVCAAISWLCKNHAGYIKLIEEGMVINDADIASLPEDDVPSVIMQNMTLSDDVEAASSESSSYVPPIDPKDDDSDAPSIGPAGDASSADVNATPPPLVHDNVDPSSNLNLHCTCSMICSGICPNSASGSSSSSSSSAPSADVHVPPVTTASPAPLVSDNGRSSYNSLCPCAVLCTGICPQCTDVCPTSGSSSPSSSSTSSSSSTCSTENVIWMDDVPIECSAVLDMDSTLVSTDMLLNGAAKNLKIPLEPDPLVICTHSNTKVSSYNNPTFWTCAFPTLFPYGTGGCDDKSPSLREWMNYLLTHRDPRFRQHYSFMFVGFNILNVREVCRQVRFTVSRPSTSQDSLTIKSADLKKVFESIKNSKSPSPHVNDPAFQKLQQQISMIGKNIEGSDFQKKYSLPLISTDRHVATEPQLNNYYRLLKLNQKSIGC